MKRALKHVLGFTLSLALFGGAAWIVYSEFRKYPLHEIVHALRGFSIGEITLAGLLTLACYWILTGYDALGFRYVHHRISYWRVTFAAFIAYAFANNVGMANFAGAAVRYRIYKGWNIEKSVIGQVVALDVLSNWIGFLLTATMVFLIDPPPVPRVTHLPFHDARPLGLISLVLVGAYFIMGLLRRRPIRIGKISFPTPHNWIFLAQVLVACLDFGLGGVVLFMLLPHATGFSYWSFLGFYMLAQTVGIISHVPGGLGVFESVMLILLRESFQGPDVIAALVAYRAIFFFVPLLMASAAWLGFEITHHDSP